MPTRAGFIFLFVLGLISVTLGLAFALLSTAQLAQSGASKIEMDVLANRAAREGVQHAIAVIHQDFASRPGVPTTLGDRWRTHFWSINAHQVGITTPATSDDHPIGKEYTAEDYFDNDVPIENFLTEPYLEVDNSRGHYIGRIRRYERGDYNHPGLARWFEPGVHSDDPVARPLSFHLPHPTPANAGSPDPAVIAGEDHLPDLDEPMWYDSELRPTDDPSKRRYRLRYATAIECLAGHLLCAVPGEYDDTAVSVLSGAIPGNSDRSRINEVDNVVADRYGGMMSNMFRYSGNRAWEWGDLGLRGLGASQQHIGYQMGYREASILAGRDGSGRMTIFVDQPGSNGGPLEPPPPGTDSRINGEAVFTDTSYEAVYFNVGPFPSFQSIWHDAANVNSNVRPYLFTPFGRAPEKVDDPQEWHQSRVDTPWRLNVPTLAPHALTAMVYAYLPDEFRTQGSDHKVTSTWDPTPPSQFKNPVSTQPTAPGIPDPPLFRRTVQAVQAFDDLASVAHFDSNGGVVPGEPYPGTRPDAPGSHWLPNLGKHVATNTELGAAGTGTLFSTSPYPVFGFDDLIIVRDAVPGGEQITLKGQLWRYDSTLGIWKPRDYSGGYGIDAGFYHHGSYWLDLSVAMIHAVAVARFSWLDRVNGAYVGDPSRGKPRWPASLPVGYFAVASAAESTPGAATVDRDVDGDGNPDVPSAFDTIAEIDDQFLRNLGEWPGDYATGSRPLLAHSALRSVPLSSRHGIPTVAVVDLDGLKSRNIKRLLHPVAGDTNPPISQEQAALMELVVNDMRMSFFGASPDYPDFRPRDLDDDGNVSCSCYATGTAPADPTTGRGPAPETWFSLTGCFVLEKSRYYRIFTRGQLFDEIRNVQVAEMNLESVYMVDPDGDMGDIEDQPSATPGNRLADSQLIFQRRLNNRYFGTKSHVDK